MKFSKYSYHDIFVEKIKKYLKKGASILWLTEGNKFNSYKWSWICNTTKR